MQEKDIIVRFSGDNSKVKEAFAEIIEQAAELGLISGNYSVYPKTALRDSNGFRS